ncbi:hypothetical protein PG994_010914 [Apiospora phragmitis]|uniref:SnoaL-like domain-containing protein n=1 Tax=Apiospora phragmitis TaxID=2905665 RepID=A0ABR1TRB9_9PEZI
MYADHPDTYVEFLGGRYRGKEGVKRLYQGRFQQSFVAGRNGPVRGFLLDHLMLQDIIDVDRTGTHAWCRMRTLMQAGTHKSVTETHPRGAVQWWEGGLYENEYLKEDGVWKLFRYRYFPFWHADFATGWQQTREAYIPWPTKPFPEDPPRPRRARRPEDALARHARRAFSLPAPHHGRARQRGRPQGAAVRPGCGHGRPPSFLGFAGRSGATRRGVER